MTDVIMLHGLMMSQYKVFVLIAFSGTAGRSRNAIQTLKRFCNNCCLLEITPWRTHDSASLSSCLISS